MTLSSYPNRLSNMPLSRNIRIKPMVPITGGDPLFGGNLSGMSAVFVYLSNKMVMTRVASFLGSCTGGQPVAKVEYLDRASDKIDITRSRARYFSAAGTITQRYCIILTLNMLAPQARCLFAAKPLPSASDI
eukprot:1560839-Pyramimonas_sp.AAC.1